MKKNIITILFAIVFLSILTTVVYGAEPQITIDGDNTVKPGKTKELTINISSNEEIGIVSGKIEANSNITDIIVTGVNSWNLTYNSNTGVFNIYKAEGAKEEEIITIQYKAGEEGTGTITLSNLKMTTINYESKDIEDVTKNITIANEQQTPELPTEKTLTSVTVTKAPTRTTYTEDENFDKTGMVVKAEYSDETSREITNYTVKNGNKLLKGQTEVTISYTEDNVTKTATQKITVLEKTPVDNNKKDDDSKAENKIPYTGTSSIAGIIAIALIFGIVSLVKYNKYKGI